MVDAGDALPAPTSPLEEGSVAPLGGGGEGGGAGCCPPTSAGGSTAVLGAGLGRRALLAPHWTNCEWWRPGGVLGRS